MTKVHLSDTIQLMSTLPATGYRTIGINTEIPWPSEETIVQFRGKAIHLLPETDALSKMVRIKTGPGFSPLEADKLILEFLSAIAWTRQCGVTATIANWCTAPLDVGKGPIRGPAGSGNFSTLPTPSDPKARFALALYREGLSVNVLPYKFLAFFKVVNILREDGRAQTQWINENLQRITDNDACARIVAIRNSASDVGGHLYRSGRCAVAHAFDQNNVVNPDDPADLRRLAEDLPLIRALAHVALEHEFDIASMP